MSQLETTDSIESLFSEAIGHHNRGELGEAMQRYQLILEKDVSHADSLHLLGVAHHQLGKSEEGVEFIRRAISVNPDEASFFSNLGTALKAVGKLVEAVEAFEAAVDLDSKFMPAYYNSGEVYCLLDRVEEAEKAYRKAVELNDSLPEVWTNLAVCLLNQDKEEEAESCLMRALDLLPSFGTALFTLARLRDRQKRIDEAKTLYSQAMSMGFDKPSCLRSLAMIAQQQSLPDLSVAYLQELIALQEGDANVYNNLYLALRAKGREEEAREALEQALRIDPEHVESLCNMGSLLNEEGSFQEALELCRQAIGRDRDCLIAYNNAGSACRGLGQLDRAVDFYSKAIDIDPSQAEVYNNLALALEFQGRLGEMEEAYQTALELRPGYAVCKSNYAAALLKAGRLSQAKELLDDLVESGEATAPVWVSLGRYHHELGQYEDSFAAYRAALELNPDEQVALFGQAATQITRDDVDEEHVFAVHQATARHLEQRATPFSHEAQDLSRRRIKIGFVSPDFRSHSVAFFIEPVLARLDRERFEIHCYASVASPDQTTERLSGLADGWHSVTHLSGYSLAKKMREDGIDVLIDLAGYTAQTQIAALMHRPAPVQATYLGYAHSTGMKSIEYRMVDGVTDPEGRTLNSETLVRLPGCFLCYRPLEGAPQVGPLPARDRGQVTFASFNNATKLTETSIRLFAKAMASVPGSRMLLKSHQAEDPAIRHRIERLFRAQGIQSSRIELMPRLSSAVEHLDLYNKVDIALDTTPYNGTTTTCEALWMGAPVVTLEGKRHAARVGASLCRAVGLEQCVAQTEEQFARISAGLAGDLDALAELRSGLRERMARSCLRDEEGFARNFETAIMEMLGRKARL